MEKGEPFCTIGGNADWCSHCGKQYEDTWKNLKWICLLTQLSHFWEYIWINPKHKYPYGHCSIIYNRQDIEAAQVYISRWVDKQLWDIYTVEYYLVIKKRKFSLCNSVDGPGEHYAEWNNIVRERQIYDFTHMWNLMNKLS